MLKKLNFSRIAIFITSIGLFGSAYGTGKPTASVANRQKPAHYQHHDSVTDGLRAATEAAKAKASTIKRPFANYFNFLAPDFIENKIASVVGKYVYKPLLTKVFEAIGIDYFDSNTLVSAALPTTKTIGKIYLDLLVYTLTKSIDAQGTPSSPTAKAVFADPTLNGNILLRLLALPNVKTFMDNNRFGKIASPVIKLMEVANFGYVVIKELKKMYKLCANASEIRNEEYNGDENPYTKLFNSVGIIANGVTKILGDHAIQPFTGLANLYKSATEKYAYALPLAGFAAQAAVGLVDGRFAEVVEKTGIPTLQTAASLTYQNNDSAIRMQRTLAKYSLFAAGIAIPAITIYKLLNRG